jgi:WD40 repeat protein
VNTVSWDPSGTRLITGSDDTYILLFDIAGKCLQRIESGHALNIFSAECITSSLSGGRLVSCGEWCRSVKAF